MKKLFSVLFLVFALTLTACGGTTLKGNEEVTMTNIDEYLETEARFIDLRNFADGFNGGYIAGFENIPFFEYLEGRALVRNNGWEFSAKDIKDEALLENLFGPKDNVVVLMCGSGTRAGYVKAALESIGYTKVINAGGIKDYKGTNKILGDAEYKLPIKFPKLPEKVDMTNIDKFLSRTGAKYVDLRNVADKYAAGYIDGFEVISFFEYFDFRAFNRNSTVVFEASHMLDAIIVENMFGDKDREIFLMCGSGTRAGYMKSVLEHIGYTNVHNVGGIKDYSGANRVLGDPDWSN